ncbi:MAG: pitrilysin family protein [Planctomycetota bacterium]|nr:pitrilysin family protein [Planctomycetota bacterium]
MRLNSKNSRPLASSPRLVLLLMFLGTSTMNAQDIPDRPEQLEFATLDFQPPETSAFRHVLSNGVPVYLAPSHELPLVNIVFTFKGGEYLDPAGLLGMAHTTGDMIRRGGTRSISAEDMDERLDFLASDVSVRVGTTSSMASLNCLHGNLDESLVLFLDMLKHPGFQANRLDTYIGELIEGMAQRNDFPEAILAREWDALLYGPDHFEARHPTRSMLQALTIQNLRSMHGIIFNPGNLIIAVNGDFEPQAMLDRLEEAMADWESRPRVDDPPAPQHELKPGVYHVEHEIPQGKVYIGSRGLTRNDPDFIPMLIANDILGGGAFTSRITGRVRDDEGLAYSANSRLIPRINYPGEFRASFQSKNRTVPLAIKIILEEIGKMRDQPVSPVELETAKNAFIESFPRRFQSKAGTLALFVDDELTGREPGYWRQFRDRIRNVTLDEVQRVMRDHLDPSTMAILVVGPWANIGPGDLEGRASMEEFFDGRVTAIPMKDPFTLQPIAQPPN